MICTDLWPISSYCACRYDWVPVIGVVH